MVTNETTLKKQKVLYIITKADVGGAQKYVSDLAANLDKERFTVKILYGGRDLKWLSNKVYPHLFFFNDWLAIFELVKIFRREQPDIIHLNSSKTGVVGSLAAWFYKLSLLTSHFPPPKVVFTAHGWVFNPTNYLSTPTRWFYILLHRCAALFQDTIINVSEYDRKLAIRYSIAPEDKLITIYNGIDPNIPFLDKQIARQELLKKFSASHPSPLTSRLWIGSIGRLTKEKDYGTLIAAATAVPEAYFFIIGSGPEYQKLKEECTKWKVNDRFFIVPPTGSDAKYLKAFDIFTLTSIKEGLPYTLLEAVAAGVPVIVTNVGGMPEVVSQRQNGRIVPLGNPQEFSSSIRELLAKRDNRWRLQTSATLTLQESFSLKKMAEATENTYRGSTSIILETF